jgi:hypothetical protein
MVVRRVASTRVYSEPKGGEATEPRRTTKKHPGKWKTYLYRRYAKTKDIWILRKGCSTMTRIVVQMSRVVRLSARHETTGVR